MTWSKPEWNKPTRKVVRTVGRPSHRNPRSTALIYALAVLVVIFLGCGILWWHLDLNSEAEDDLYKSESTDQPSHKNASLGKSITTQELRNNNIRPRKGESVAKNGGPQASVSAVERTKHLISAERQQKEAWRLADSNRLAKSEAILAAQVPRKFFDNEVDNTLEIISKPGAQFLILPQVNLSQQEVLDYLKSPITIFEDDDEEAVAAKKRTASFKEQALEFIEKGGTMNQFIREQAAAAANEREVLDEIRREKDGILVSEGPEAAKAYLDKINRKLRDLNMPEIRMGRADISKLRHQQRMLQQQKEEKQQ